MAVCPYYKGHECIALDLYREDRFGDRYPYSPCTKDCNQLKIKYLEDKIKNKEDTDLIRSIKHEMQKL